MRSLFLVNRPRSLDGAPTTRALVLRSASRFPTWVTACTDLGSSGFTFRAVARRVHPDGRIGKPTPIDQNDLDVVIVRANPLTQSKPWAWDHALTCLEQATALGLPVRNDPVALRTFASKPGLLLLSESVRPPTVLTARVDTVLQAVEAYGKTVVKPAHGSHGRGVFIVAPDSPNLKATVELLVENGPVVVQPWLPAAVEGDVRIFVADGEPFAIQGRIAAIRRRPATGELRSNVHLGGKPEGVDPPPELVDLATCAAAELLERGVRFAGLDCIGDRLVEANVCAPGGLPDMSNVYGHDYVGGWIDRLTAP